MNKSQQVKFESLYRKHVSALKRQGKAEKTVDAYSRAVRRLSAAICSTLSIFMAVSLQSERMGGLATQHLHP